jgi:hypothetical protein
MTRGLTPSYELNSSLETSEDDDDIIILFDLKRAHIPIYGTDVYLNLTGTEQISASAVLYEFDFEIEVYQPDIEEMYLSESVALLINCLENQSVHSFIRYINTSIPIGDHLYCSGIYEFNTLRPIDVAQVILRTEDGASGHFLQRNQHAEYDQKDTWALPILTTNPNRFDYTLDLYISDGVNLSHHFITNEVFWPNISDFIAFGRTTAETLSETPVNSVLFDTMNWSFYARACIKNVGEEWTITSCMPNTYKILPPNESDCHQFVWHSFIDNYNNHTYITPYNYHYAIGDARYFTHEYEILIGTLNDSGISIELEFGVLNLSERKIPGYHGLFLIGLLTILALVIHLRRRKLRNFSYITSG